MKTQNIDILNIGLVVLSLLLAIYLPFKLFLISYAVLGPLHYLTEINWLNDKQYFIKDHKKWIWVLIASSIVISINPIVGFFELELSKPTSKLLALIHKYSNHGLLISFILSISLILLKKKKQILTAFITALIATLFIGEEIPNSMLFIGMFIPTLFHVFLFTLLFILYGAIKAKSKPGYILSATLLITPAIILSLDIPNDTYKLTQDTFQTFVKSGMINVVAKIAEYLNLIDNGNLNLISGAVIKVQIFIAFAYTYHYLNWFSKTSIIGWKKALNIKSTAIIISLWVASVALYFYDYRVGFTALFFLSFLHVLLEFPLNVLSIKGIIKLGK